MQQACCSDNVNSNSSYAVRNAQPSDVLKGSPQDSANSSGSTRQTMTSTTTSLPSRHRDVSDIDSDRAGSDSNPQLFFPRISRPGNGPGQGGTADVDMDFSPDFGLGERNPPSDHPTPSTLNSSSNTSYSISGADNQSPGKKHQKSAPSSATSIDKVHSVHISRSTTEAPQVPDLSSLVGQVYPNSTGSMGTTGAPNAFSMSSSWDMPTPNPTLNNMDFGNMNVDNLSEAQWAQILNNNGNGAGWDDWRPS